MYNALLLVYCGSKTIKVVVSYLRRFDSCNLSPVIMTFSSNCKAETPSSSWFPINANEKWCSI